jgi:hypothetical protein
VLALHQAADLLWFHTKLLLLQDLLTLVAVLVVDERVPARGKIKH